jgi:hypothetical protein
VNAELDVLMLVLAGSGNRDDQWRSVRDAGG